MVGVENFLIKVEEIAAEDPSYRKGGTGTDGTCDCIGLIVGAIRRAGGVWTGGKGSNYTARNEVKYLNPIKTASQLKAGEAVFKALAPGEEGYDAETINSRYASSPDKLDYYHIGVVLSVNPLRIRHMTTPKVKIDTKIGKWKYCGWLKKIAADGGTAMQETVIIKGGNASAPINMRSGPSKSNKIIGEIIQGQAAVLLDVVNDDWCLIQVNGKTGYVQQVFVRRTSQTPTDTISVPTAELEQVYNMIGTWLGRRG